MAPPKDRDGPPNSAFELGATLVRIGLDCMELGSDTMRSREGDCSDGSDYRDRSWCMLIKFSFKCSKARSSKLEMPCRQLCSWVFEPFTGEAAFRVFLEPS